MPETKEVDARVQLVEALWAQPDSRAVIEAEIVKKFPGAKASLPHVAAREVGEEMLAEVRKEREAIEAMRAEDRGRRELDAARREIMGDPSLRITEAELGDVEKLMQAETIGSHRAAAEMYRHRQRIAPAGPASQPGTMDVPGLRGAGGDEFKGLLEDPQAWARGKAYEVLHSFERVAARA